MIIRLPRAKVCLSPQLYCKMVVRITERICANPFFPYSLPAAAKWEVLSHPNQLYKTPPIVF